MNKIKQPIQQMSSTTWCVLPVIVVVAEGTMLSHFQTKMAPRLRCRTVLSSITVSLTMVNEEVNSILLRTLLAASKIVDDSMSVYCY